MGQTPGSELTGTTIGQYKVKEIIGRGGMATVYLAEQTTIGRTVAVKVMPPHLQHDPTFAQRFEQEVKVIADLQHPRVLPVYDYGNINGRPYIVMAYIGGGTLTDLIKQGPMDIDKTVKLLTQISEGLSHAHNRGVVHRDFKPSNVLLDDAGNAYLADFGIAKLNESTVNLTGSGVIGTPAYMAPEMAQEGSVTSAVDIYALGTTLFEMLTGRYPFEAETALKMMMAHVSEPVPRVSTIRDDIPEALDGVIATAMAKDPDDRYPTPLAFAENLRIAADGGDPMVTVGLPTTDAADAPPSTQEADDEYTAAPSPTPKLATDPLNDAQPQKKGGCGRTALIIGGIIGVLGCVVLGGLFALGAIGSSMEDDPTEAPPPTEETLPTEPPTEEAPPTEVVVEEGGYTLNVINNMGLTVCEVNVSSADSDVWGDNRLSDGLAADSNEVIGGIEEGEYDLRVLDCQGNVIGWLSDVTFDQGQQWTLTRASLTVINEYTDELCEVYISPTTSDTWGINFVDDPIPVDSEREFVIVEATYDLRAVACNEVEVTQQDEAIEGERTWTIFASDE